MKAIEKSVCYNNRKTKSFSFTCLNLWYRCGVSVAQGGHWQIEFPFIVALAEELFANLQAPFPADLPGSARVRYVGALECNLKH